MKTGTVPLSSHTFQLQSTCKGTEVAPTLSSTAVEKDSESGLVTQLLVAIKAGDQSKMNQLYQLVYAELHRQAGFQRRRWHGDLTMNTTALVHEAYIKLVDQENTAWNSRAHFLAVASKAMRHILTDYARRRSAGKRGGDVRKVSLDELLAGGENSSAVAAAERAEGLLALHEALERLAEVDPRAAVIVECRFFGEMTVADISEVTDLSESTVKRDWAVAQAWLKRELAGSGGDV